jgi:hypothetical protein
MEAIEIREGASTNDKTPILVHQAIDGGMIDFLGLHFLSQDELKIIEVLFTGPAKGAVIMQRTKVERSKFYVLAANLSDRGLIRSVSDGYELADPLIRKAVAMIRDQHEGENT